MEHLYIGRVLRSHGINGEIQVEPLTHDPRRFENLKRVFIDGEEYPVEKCRFNKERILLKLKGIDTFEAAQCLKGKYTGIPSKERMELPPGYFYIFELLGAEVITTGGESIGRITDVLTKPANDVYLVDNGSNEFLIPAIKEVVKSVKIDEKIVVIEPIPGLLEGL